MKIATWNLERLAKGKNQLVFDKLVDLNADIFVLTETNSIIQFEDYNCVSTDPLPANFDGMQYQMGENRVSILTRYKIRMQHNTFDSYTTVCTDIETPYGLLTVYGSIMGVFGNRQPRFDNDLKGQLDDFEKIFPGRMVCLAGDLNVTFSGQAWPSNKARQTLVNAFNTYGLTNTTAGIADTVDHIIISKEFLSNKHLELETWNIDKKLSDHVGHELDISH